MLNLLLLLALIGLLGLGAWFWFNPPKIQPVSLSSPATAGEISLTGNAASDGSFGVMADIADYQEIITRPLFFQARRPPKVDAEEPDTGPVESVEEEELSLVGVMGVASQRIALVQNVASGKTTLLKAGDSLDGWRVVSIDTDAVSVLNAKGENKRLALIRNKRKPTQRISQQAERLRRLREIAAQQGDTPAGQSDEPTTPVATAGESAPSDEGAVKEPTEQTAGETAPASDAAVESAQPDQTRDPAAELRQKSRKPMPAEQAPKN